MILPVPVGGGRCAGRHTLVLTGCYVLLPDVRAFSAAAHTATGGLPPRDTPLPSPITSLPILNHWAGG